MHEMIHRALAADVERERLGAARAAHMRRAREPAPQQPKPTASGPVVIPLAGPHAPPRRRAARGA
jgi:hypothetical protein